MIKQLNSQLQAKLTFLQIMLVLIPVIIVASYAAVALTQALTAQQTQGESSLLHSKVQTVQVMLNRIQTDLLVLSRTSIAQRYANSLVGQPNAQAESDLQELFASFLSNVDTPYK